MKIFKLSVKILLYVITVAVFAASSVFILAARTQEKTGCPGAFGYSIATVMSNSMSGTFETGDLVVGKMLADVDSVNVGDVVSYRGIIQNVETVITHRVTDKISDGNGGWLYVTQGDNRTYDYEGETGVCPDPDEGYRTRDELISVYRFKIPGLGKVITFLRSTPGFICVIAPVVVLIIYEIISLVMIIVKNRETVISEKAGRREQELIEKYELELKRLRDSAAAAEPVTESGNE